MGNKRHVHLVSFTVSCSNFPFGLGFLLATFFFVFGTLFGRKKVALLNPFYAAKPTGKLPVSCVSTTGCRESWSIDLGLSAGVQAGVQNQSELRNLKLVFEGFCFQSAVWDSTHKSHVKWPCDSLAQTGCHCKTLTNEKLHLDWRLDFAFW